MKLMPPGNKVSPCTPLIEICSRLSTHNLELFSRLAFPTLSPPTAEEMTSVRSRFLACGLAFPITLLSTGLCEAGLHYKYLVLINRAGGLYRKILTEVVKVQTERSEVCTTTEVKIFLYRPTKLG